MILNEGFEYKDLEGLVKPVIHVDEFVSKMGDDDDICVISFYVRDELAADDLINWFEKGYDFVMDADRSPGEVKANRYLVYVELKRRSYTAEKIQSLLDDLSTLTEFDASDWTMHYKKKQYPWSEETFNRLVPNSPTKYRAAYESDLNEMRSQAGLDVKLVYEKDKNIRSLQSAAGL